MKWEAVCVHGLKEIRFRVDVQFLDIGVQLDLQLQQSSENES